MFSFFLFLNIIKLPDPTKMHEVVMFPDTSLELKMGDLDCRDYLQTEIEENLPYLLAFNAVFDHQYLNVIKVHMPGS